MLCWRTITRGTGHCLANSLSLMTGTEMNPQPWRRWGGDGAMAGLGV